MQGLLLILLMMVLSGCAHTVTLTNFETGEVLHGQYNELDRSVTVTMPDADILSGKYSAFSNAALTFGNAFVFSGTITASGFGTGVTVGGTSNAYALLTSKTSKLAMEIIVAYSEWSGHGYGEARTNDGRAFKVQF